MAHMPHMKRREGDEWFCPRCTLRWGIEEEPPGPCIEDRQQSIQSAANAAHALAVGARTASQKRYWERVERHHLSRLSIPASIS